MIGIKSREIWENGNSRLERRFLEKNLSGTFVPDDFTFKNLSDKKRGKF